MDALDSPLEALALNYLTYAFLTAVNNIWAWVAVFTAAVSFWRIRALSSPPVSTPELGSRSLTSPPKNVSENTAEEAKPAIKKFSRTLERECVTKTKFSLYYYDDDFREDEQSGENEDKLSAAPAVMSQKLDRRCDDWERVMRMGDMGWYRWQDTTALDGSVVRLWDGCRRRHAAALVVDSTAAAVW